MPATANCFATDHHSSPFPSHSTVFPVVQKSPAQSTTPSSHMPKRRKEESDGEETSSSSSSKKKKTADDLGTDASWSDSGGNYSTTVPKLPSNNVGSNNNNNIHGGGRGGGGEDPEDPTGSKVSSAIPIFLKKTYRMIDTCDPEICSWTADGEMFVVKNPVRERDLS